MCLIRALVCAVLLALPAVALAQTAPKLTNTEAMKVLTGLRALDYYGQPLDEFVKESNTSEGPRAAVAGKQYQFPNAVIAISRDIDVLQHAMKVVYDAGQRFKAQAQPALETLTAAQSAAAQQVMAARKRANPRIDDLLNAAATAWQRLDGARKTKAAPAVLAAAQGDYAQASGAAASASAALDKDDGVRAARAAYDKAHAALERRQIDVAKQIVGLDDQAADVKGLVAIDPADLWATCPTAAKECKPNPFPVSVIAAITPLFQQ